MSEVRYKEINPGVLTNNPIDAPLVVCGVRFRMVKKSIIEKNPPILQFDN